jgi:hypothetical protein
MGWEWRRRGGRYYTRSKKVNGRVVREYVGRGPVAELATLADAERRALREARAAAWRRQKEELAALDDRVQALCDLADLVVTAALLAAGYHRPKREWRKRRVSTAMTSPGAASPAQPRMEEETLALLLRAQRGDEAALPAVREFLQQDEVAKSFGGIVAVRVQEALVGAMTGRNLLFREALLRKLQVLRRELAGPKPTALESLLVERVVACWLQVQHADTAYARLENATLAQGDYYQRRQDRAHKRFLGAVKALALVRRMAVPALVQQINVAAHQQVNVVT